jgi:tryptophan synthase alpha chain
VSRISDRFKDGHKALMPYVTVGYPSIEATVEIVLTLADLGCDIVELGMPFSDPLADGATIQNASLHALHNGVTPQICIDTARRIRQKTDVPLVFMSYFNPILANGLNAFVEGCAAAGVDGMIVPDLPPEEGGDLESLTRQRGIDLVYLIAPTSTPERIRMVAGHSRGFVYLVSVAGVTGARSEMPPDLESFARRVKVSTQLPACVGFGISTPEQARDVSRFADGIIVGSRLVQLLDGADWKTRVRVFVREIRAAMDSR